MKIIFRHHGGYFQLSQRRNISSNNKRRYARRDTEDRLDYLHRLLKQHVGIETTADLTGFPVESVRYIKDVNEVNWK